MNTATITTTVSFKLHPAARLLLHLAAFLCYLHLPLIPHPLVVWVVCRSWYMRLGSGQWERVTIDAAGRVINKHKEKQP